MIKVGGEKTKGNLHGIVTAIYERFYVITWDIGYRECVPMPRVATPVEQESNGCRWTCRHGFYQPYEIETLMDMSISNDRAAAMLGRTVNAVWKKRQQLRKAAVA